MGRVPEVAVGDIRSRPRPSEGDGGGERDRWRPRPSGSVGELGGAGGWSIGDSRVGERASGEGGVRMMTESEDDEGERGRAGRGGEVGAGRGGVERCREERARARGPLAALLGLIMMTVVWLISGREMIRLIGRISPDIKKSRALKSDVLASLQG